MKKVSSALLLIPASALVLLSIVPNGAIASALTESDSVLAQSGSTEDRKAEADRLLDLGDQQYQRSQFLEAVQSWEAALALYQALQDRQGEAHALNNLGIAHWFLSEIHEAIAYFEQALSLFQALENLQGEALALMHLGAAHDSLNETREAIAYFEQALLLFQSVENREGEASTLMNLGLAYNSRGESREAIAYYEQALPLYQALENRWGEANTLNNLGLAYGAIGDLREAIAYYEQALPLYQAIENRWGEANILNNLGSAYGAMGDVREAIAYFEQALPLYQAIQNRQGEADALTNLGSVAHLLGNMPEAIAYYEQSLSLFRVIQNREGEADTLMNLGTVYRSLNDMSRAIAYFEQALPLYQALENRWGEAATFVNLGNTYRLLGNMPEAIAYFEQALPLFQSIENRQGEADSLMSLGIAYWLLNNTGEAIAYYEQALPLYQSIEDRRGEASTLMNLGVAYRSLSNTHEAIAYFEQALPLFQAIEDRSGQSVLFVNFGSFLAAQGQPELAIAFYKASVNFRESIRAEIRELPEELQATYTESISDSYRELVRLLLEQDRVLEAQQVLELLRVQEIDEYLRDLRGNAQTAEGLDLWEAEQQLLTIYREMVEAGQGFEAFLNRPEVQSFTRQLQRNARGQNLNPETLVRLQNNLRQLDNAALLYPLILEDRLELVLVTPEGLRRETVAIDRVQLNQLIADFRADITGRNPDVEQSAQQLYDLLIRPLAPYLSDTQTILYAADGQLRYIPLAALHDGEQWLAQRFSVNLITAASLTDWGRSQSSDLSVLAGAFSEGSYQIEVGDRIFSFNGLQFAGIEVERIAADIPSTQAYFNQDFSRAAVEAQLADYSILHFATHAEFVVGTPHESFILFGNGDSVNLQDIANWSLSGVDLVVLSACRTAVSGELGQGEEILGFGYQIQRTGARAAIASLWYVNDGGTQVLMNAFYTALQQGMTKAEALRQAQIALITGDNSLISDQERTLIIGLEEEGRSPQTTAAQLSHPYYWAPFILIGNGL